ncbi:hypothetical protein [Patulibacter sp.]|uniref:nucleotide-binding protein n=1 Tax=Patulibacter sp. TaxID=1912859 RepID=UPI00272790A4|nr:hypothetical protein [Patulibacter sp.]MDO9407862.1 hypothetical protein [Patulibacter sp.]
MTTRGLVAQLPRVALVVACLVLGAVLGTVLATDRRTVWDGEALLRADPTPATGSGAATRGDAATFAAAAAAAITAPAVVEVASSTPLPAPVTDVRATVRPGTAIVEVRVTSDDRSAAATGARTYALALRTVRTASERGQYRRAATTLRESATSAGRGRLPDAVVAQLAELETAARSVLPLTIVRVGTVRERSSGTETPVAAGVGAAGGLLVALLLLAGGWGWRRRGRRIATLPALRSGSGTVPVIGAVPPLRTYARRGRGRSFGITASEVETFRMVRRGLRDAASDRGQVVLVTSAQAGAGKSTVAVGLAAAAAEAGERALVVECDLRIPSIAGRLGLRPGPGLSDYLGGRAEPRATLQEARLPGGPAAAPSFWVVTAGSADVPPDRLGGREIAEMLGHVRDGYDVVILDAPPLIGAVDAGHLVPQADVVALCVRLGRITRPALAAATDLAVRATDADRVRIVATGVGSSRDPAGETTIYGPARDR